jgi:hypothetical protein
MADGRPCADVPYEDVETLLTTLANAPDRAEAERLAEALDERLDVLVQEGTRDELEAEHEALRRFLTSEPYTALRDAELDVARDLEAAVRKLARRIRRTPVKPATKKKAAAPKLDPDRTDWRPPPQGRRCGRVGCGNGEIQRCRHTE